MIKKKTKENGTSQSKSIKHSNNKIGSPMNLDSLYQVRRLTIFGIELDLK